MQLKNFEYENDQEVRTVEINGQIWWVASDICHALGIANSRDATISLDDDEKTEVVCQDSANRNQKMSVINEPGLYHLIFKSQKPGAKKFQKWIYHDVIPQIRKTGAYATRGAIIPAFIRRFNENWDRIETGYFSVISELVIRIYGRLEQAGYLLPDRGKKGHEIRPDVSVGKLFPAWLEQKAPDKVDRYKTYMHKLPDGMEVSARQYDNTVLADFIEYVDTVWLPTRAETYFRERDVKALEYLAKFLPKMQVV